MRYKNLIQAGMLAVALSVAAPSFAQEHGKIAPASARNETAAAQNWTTEQLITSSVHDAWLLSGKNEATFFEMVTQLAVLSAEKRNLTLPETEAAGRRLGEFIKTQAKLDTSQLLYVVVDKAVQRVGVPAKS